MTISNCISAAAMANATQGYNAVRRQPALRPSVSSTVGKTRLIPGVNALQLSLAFRMCRAPTPEIRKPVYDLAAG